MKKASLCLVSVLIAVSFLLSEAVASVKGLLFMPNDYSKALAEAKQRKLPMFVEVWAPW